MNKIPFPGDDSIREISRNICRQELPTAGTILGFLRKMTRSIGFWRLLSGSLDSALIALAVFLLIGLRIPMEMFQDPQREMRMTVFAFGSSPLFLGLYILLSLWKEQENPLRQILMTCKYTQRHVTVYCVFCWSALGLILEGIYVILLSHSLGLPALRMVLLCFVSLFLFSLLLLSVMLRSDRLWGAAGVCLLWFLGTLCGMFLFPGVLAALLLHIPIVAWILALILLILVINDRVHAYFYRRLCYADS